MSDANTTTIDRGLELSSFDDWETRAALDRIARRRAQRALRRRRRQRRRRIVAVTAIVAGAIGLFVLLGSSQRATPAAAGRAGAHGPLAGDRGIRGHRGESPPDTLPFAHNPADRATRPGEAPSLYADGLSCSTGCRPYGAEIGWPLAPFHREHPIRAGLNELRTGSLHVGVDIQARNGARVYAVQPGTAVVLTHSGPNARVQVGNYIYWHINPRVRTGELVTPFKTVLGTVMRGYGHIAFSELNAAGDYVNPLRPGGTVLEPYADRAAPVIGAPAVAADGQVIVPAYSPQTFLQRTTYVTPVLAPAAIAYRLYSPSGAPLTPLEWAFRGTHLLPWTQRSLMYAPGAHAPGYGCFATRTVCVPDWVYRAAGGFAPPLPSTLAPGRFRLTIYAWDWADNKTALDTTVTMTATGWLPIGRFPSLLFRIPGYFTRSQLLPQAPTGVIGHAPVQAAPASPLQSNTPVAPSPAPASPAPAPAHGSPAAPSGGAGLGQ